MLGHGQLDCGMGEMESCEEDLAHSTNEPSIIPPSCCSNDYYSAESDEYFNHIEILLTSDVLFDTGYVISFFENAFSENHLNLFIAESPPLSSDDRQVWHQTFLL